MKIKFVLMVVFVFVFVSSTVVLPAQRDEAVISDVPVYMEIPSVEIEFPLEPRPADRTAEQGVPYVSGPAFWRENGYAVEISSHCSEDPGKFFYQIKEGDEIVVTYDDEHKQTFVVIEYIKIRYTSLSDPLGSAWVDQHGREFTEREFAEYALLEHGNVIALHSSICVQGLSIGQHFFIAK